MSFIFSYHSCSNHDKLLPVEYIPPYRTPYVEIQKSPITVIYHQTIHPQSPASTRTFGRPAVRRLLPFTRPSWLLSSLLFDCSTLCCQLLVPTSSTCSSILRACRTRSSSPVSLQEEPWIVPTFLTICSLLRRCYRNSRFCRAPRSPSASRHLQDHNPNKTTTPCTCLYTDESS